MKTPIEIGANTEFTIKFNINKEILPLIMYTQTDVNNPHNKQNRA